MSLPDLVVGTGVRDAMAAAADEPRGHERYTNDPASGAVLYSETHGRDALYRWTPRDGVKRLPFAPPMPRGLAAAGAGPAEAVALAPLWRPSPNFTPGRAAVPIALVLHITDGGDPTGWFATPASQVSTHFSVLRGGSVVQHVQLENTAWANGVVTSRSLPSWCPAGVNPNAYTVSVEHEGRPWDDVGEGFGCLSAAQARASIALQRWLAATVPTLAHTVPHALFDPVNRTNCPGPRFPWQAFRDAGLTMD